MRGSLVGTVVDLQEEQPRPSRQEQPRPGGRSANETSPVSNCVAMTTTSVFQSGQTFPASRRGRRRCRHAVDCSSFCSSVLGQVEGRGSHTAECSASLHIFLPLGTRPDNRYNAPPHHHHAMAALAGCALHPATRFPTVCHDDDAMWLCLPSYRFQLWQEKLNIHLKFLGYITCQRCSVRQAQPVSHY